MTENTMGSSSPMLPCQPRACFQMGTTETTQLYNSKFCLTALANCPCLPGGATEPILGLYNPWKSTNIMVVSRCQS